MNDTPHRGGELYDEASAAIPSLSIDHLLSLRAAMLERYEKILTFSPRLRRSRQRPTSNCRLRTNTGWSWPTA
jgi:hypothetical protein